MRKFIVTLLTWLSLMTFSSVNLAHSAQYSYGPTKQNDRLWQIALNTRPSSDITPQQMMVALVQRNPFAFKDHNVNGLYTGIRLRIPAYNDIITNTPLQAELMVKKHNQLWKAGIPVAIALPSPTHVVADTASVPASATRARGVAELPVPNVELIKVQKHLEVLNSNVQDFVLQSHLQLTSMAEGQMVLKKQLTNMARSMNELNEQIDKQNTTITESHNTYVEDQYVWQETLQNYVMAGGAILALFGFLLIATWIKISKLTQRIALAEAQPTATPMPEVATKTVAAEDEELEDEYDFINSAEGIPAKLDLARAYMDMDDLEGAREILNEIITNSSEAYQIQAKQLLSHIQLPHSAHHEPA